MFPTKIKTLKVIATKKNEQIVEKILFLRNVRLSNKNFDIENLPVLFYELILRADNCFENHERNLRLGSIELAKVNAQIFSKLTQMLVPK